MKEGTILVIVDGAAFGSEMKDISECIKTQGNIVLYAPESFEWLLLSNKGNTGSKSRNNTSESRRIYRQ
mgnify:FL=1